ncbi:ATP-dependent (S)-NAD(P)H-hydrate dehydratase [Aspergillus homomorphus CBS 101889]|uniref:Ribokinase-like protein n=1 Tax=Aspergillus homomorphus (strain CBS 101889) TaxID=1450537 RepID=A0A395HKK8_ASPHC|nr:Ribokinase-like protein [Aspergillus homomorphus CBS 101889]RAL07953.1 Ribokinase-like protein [Aspergillus homomorphus CBS 101889]
MASGALAHLTLSQTHVFCEESAAPVIKSYSLDPMVHPLLPSSNTTTRNADLIDMKELVGPIINMLSSLYCLVIGPGLGTVPITWQPVSEVMRKARGRLIPFVLDADGLKLVKKMLDLVKAVALDIEKIMSESPDKTDDYRAQDAKIVGKLAEALGGVTILRKGSYDVILNGLASLIQDTEGGMKHSGGQGDTLKGSLGTLMSWGASYHDRLWDSGENDSDQGSGGRIPLMKKRDIEREIESDMRLSPTAFCLLVAWAGSGITRECSRGVYKAEGCSMQASDLTSQVHDSFLL